ncbi:hypothetical protein NARC_10239 [Candidatus Nitrosocosmicus arcticus]|uniref:Uncharacterized protein n=1 Tax=Candidatus Nitrosocosmicus arcticus TaxID=2035267 RepID=A0A557SZ08_9ARCH|nr:hypothetical protein NARC_10239 [Candidatus Nitrosocosmicus arcticus]
MCFNKRGLHNDRKTRMNTFQSLDHAILAKLLKFYGYVYKGVTIFLLKMILYQCM